MLRIVSRPCLGVPGCLPSSNTHMTYRSNSRARAHTHAHTHRDNSLCQWAFLGFPPPPADSCAQKCVETHSWRRHFPVCLRHSIPQTHTRPARARLPGALQLSACISVSTCARLHIHHGFTAVPTYRRSTSCTLKVSQRSCVTMVTAPPWRSRPRM